MSPFLLDNPLMPPEFLVAAHHVLRQDGGLVATDLHPSRLPYGHLSHPRWILPSAGGEDEGENGEGLGYREGAFHHFLGHGTLKPKAASPSITTTSALRRRCIATTLYYGVFHLAVQGHAACCLRRLRHCLPDSHSHPHLLFSPPVGVVKQDRCKTGNNRGCVYRSRVTKHICVLRSPSLFTAPVEARQVYDSKRPGVCGCWMTPKVIACVLWRLALSFYRFFWRFSLARPRCMYQKRR